MKLPAISKEKNSEYMTEQLKEMLSPFNCWVTGVNLGHPPTSDECMMHFALYGGSADFEKRWKLKHAPIQCEDAGY